MKPGRPFGLSLAIIASVLLYTVLPLMQVGMVLIVQYRLQRQIAPDSSLNGDEFAPIAVGGDFTGVAENTLFLQFLLGVAFFIIAVFAWRGRPPFVRYLLIAAVCGLTLLTLATSFAPLLSQPNLEQGLDSGAGVVRSLLTSRILLTILIPLYVLWYINRAPARAFFRGYYLQPPTDSDAGKISVT